MAEFPKLLVKRDTEKIAMRYVERAVAKSVIIKELRDAGYQIKQ